MRKTFLLKTMLLLCALVAGSSSVWAADVTLTASSGFSSSYSSNHTFTASSVGFKDSGIMYNGKGTPSGFALKQVIQMRKSGNSGAGEIYNTTAISITSVEVTLVNNNYGFTLYYGSSENPSTNSIASSSLTPVTGSFSYKTSTDGTSTATSYKFTFDLTDENATYIKIVNGSNANYVGSIVINYEEVPAFTITPAVNNALYGSVSLSGSTITADPEDGYRVMNGTAGYNVTVGTATVAHEGHSNTLTVTPSTDCTVQVNFEAIPPHTATFSVNGVESSDEFLEDELLSFPSVPEYLGGKKFMGWYTSEYTNASVAPSYVNTATETMGENNVKYYAVFAEAGKATEWHKKAASEISEAGVYALITTDGHAFNGSISSGNGQATTNTFSFTNNVATSAPTGTCEITLVAVSGGYKMYNSSTEKYLYASKAASGGLAWHDTEESYWSYTSTPSNWQYNKDYESKYARLRSYNNSSFRTYSGDNGAELVFAKKVEVDVYSNYCTSIPPVSITPAYAKITYVTPCAMDFTGVDGLKAYVATDADASSVTMNKVEAVPESTPLLLIGTAGTTYNVPVVASATAPETNLLSAGDGTTEFDGTTYDYLLYSDGKFYQIGSGTIAVGKAYLHLASAPSSRSLDIVFGDETDGITTNNREAITNNRYYNLQGVEVAQPTRGLYIVNGKKVVIK